MPKKSRTKRNQNSRPAPAERKPAPRHCDSVFDLADSMETPLNRAEDLIRALEYVGYGLSSLEEDGAPAVFAIAQALSENLKAVKNSWKKLFDRSAEDK